MKEEKIELNEKTDLISIETKCPVCNDKYLHGVPYVQVPCNKCGISYKTEFKQDIYTKKAKRINQKLRWNDRLIITATDKYFSSVLNISDDYKAYKNWDVEEITQSKEEYKYCTKCGTCHSCFTCKDCNEPFKKDENKRKQKCPKCKSDNIKKTKFKDATQLKNKRACPECQSEKISMTRTDRKTKCHNCGSNKLTESRINIIYTLVINRKGGYRL